MQPEPPAPPSARTGLTALLTSGDPRVRLPAKLFSHNDQRWTVQSSMPEGAVSGCGGARVDPYSGVNGTPLLSLISMASGSAVFLSGDEISPYQMTLGGAVPVSPAVIERGPAPSALANLLQQRRTHVLEEAYAQVVRFSMATQAVVASALGMKRQVFYVRHPAYDTHGGQRQVHARLLGELSVALTDYHAATVAAGVADRLTLFTASDFGRTLVSNGDGTDHGWGSHHFIVGGAVKGAAFYGTPPPLGFANTDRPEDQWHVGQGCLLPSTSVAQYMATLALWFGVPRDRLADFIPDIGRFGGIAEGVSYPVDLGFMI